MSLASQKKRRAALLLGLLFAVLGSSRSRAAAVRDFSPAVIVCGDAEGAAASAARFLQGEIERRSHVRLPLASSIPRDATPAIVLGSPADLAARSALPAMRPSPHRPEGFAVWLDSETRAAATLCLAGRDRKGLLFAAGWLLRNMYLANHYVGVPEGLAVSSAPAYPLRGQQIIQSTQSEDRFLDWKNTEQRRQYIRDLALFGNNTIEPKVAGDIDQYCEQLGIDLAYTVNCSDVIQWSQLSDEEIRGVLADVVGIDQFVTYGGDHSGSRPPQETFPALERVAPLLLQSHPGATWWYSNQCIENHAVDYDDYVFPYLQKNRPRWLRGLIYGPWTKRSAAEIRKDLPAQYAIRHYPDICHVRWCMYPVPKWDRAWAQVWDRNISIYAMPRMMKAIHNAVCENTIGATPYNHTGVYNDLNKFVFTAMGWDPTRDVRDVLRDYARVFFAYDFVYSPPTPEAIDRATDQVAGALLLLEDNWTGPLAGNATPERALAKWREIAAAMGGPETVRRHWRLELFLPRAWLDTLVKRKYDAEMRCVRLAYESLEKAPTVGVAVALADARAALAGQGDAPPAREELRRQMKDAGIEGRYGDLEETLDSLDGALTDRVWLADQLQRVKSLADIDRILRYEDPGPGGFYDNLGAEGKQPHLVRPRTWAEDPGFVRSPIEWNDHSPDSARRQSQQSHAVSRYDEPLVMRWEGLDPNASYHIDVVYLGPFDPQIRCDTDDGYPIHGVRGKTEQTPVSYKIPAASTKDGTLQLQWRLANPTRGASVTEIWLKKD